MLLILDSPFLYSPPCILPRTLPPHLQFPIPGPFPDPLPAPFAFAVGYSQPRLAVPRSSPFPAFPTTQFLPRQLVGPHTVIWIDWWWTWTGTGCCQDSHTRWLDTLAPIPPHTTGPHLSHGPHSSPPFHYPRSHPRIPFGTVGLPRRLSRTPHTLFRTVDPCITFDPIVFVVVDKTVPPPPGLFPYHGVPG